MYHHATVFLIENDAAARDALSISVSMAGLKMKAYSSDSEFLNAYRANRLGCLIMGISESNMQQCLAVQQALPRRQSLLPVIYMAGFGMLRFSIRAMQTNAFACLEKPISRQLLLETVYKAIDQDCRNRSAGKSESSGGIGSRHSSLTSAHGQILSYKNLLAAQINDLVHPIF